jgi:hypothetical protein
MSAVVMASSIHAGRISLAWIVLAALPPAARAQAPPPPSEADPARPARWAFRLRLQESYDSNAEFALAQGRGSFEDQAGAGLSLRLAGRRGGLILSGDGWGRRYHSVEGADGFDCSAGLDGHHRFSPRVTGRLRGTFSDGVSRHERQLVDAGLQLPLARTRTVDGSAGLAVQLAAHTTLTAEGRYERASFESPALADGQQWSGGASLARALGASDRLSVHYVLREIRREDEGRRVHDLFAGWSRTLARRLAAELSAGASRRPDTLQRGSLQGRYSHTLGEAYGLGRERVADVVSALLEHRLGRRADVTLGGGYAFSGDPLDAGFRYRAQNASLGLAFALGRDLRLSARYGLSRSRERGGAEPIVSQYGSLSLAYAVEWR